MWIREYAVGYGRIGIDMSTGEVVYVLLCVRGTNSLRDLALRPAAYSFLVHQAREGVGCALPTEA